MCEPLSIAAMAATLGGTLLQQQARAQQQESMDRASAESVQRSSKYAQDANQLFRDSTAKVSRDTYDESLNKNAEQRKQGLLPPEMLPALVHRAGDSDATAAATDAAASKTKDALTQQGEARANLSAQGDAFRDLNMAIQPNGERIGFLQRDIQANDSLLPLQLTRASRAGGGLRDIGSIVSGLGTVGGMAAGAGQSFGTIGNAVSDGWNWLSGSPSWMAKRAAQITI